MNNNPLIGIGIASFDIMSGIHIIEKWIFQEEDITNQLESLFRMTLSTVHRQEEEFFTDILFSTIEISTNNWFVETGIFYLNSKPKNIFISICLIFKSNNLVKSIRFHECSIYYIKLLTNIFKVIYFKNEINKKLKNLIENIYEDFNILSNCIPSASPTFEIDQNESQFFTNILQSHFKTQMNTIIESSNLTEAQRIFNFLAQFTLPNLFEFSSNELKKYPNYFLHVQCIEKQNIPIEDILISFPGPCTFIKVLEKQVFMTPPKKTHILARNEFNDLIATSYDIEDIDQKKKFLKSKTIPFKLRQVNNACSTIKDFVKNFISTIPLYRLNLSEQWVSSLIRKSLNLITIINDNLEISNSTILTSDQFQEIIKLFSLKDIDEIDILISFSCLIDENILKVLPPIQKDSKFLF